MIRSQPFTYEEFKAIYSKVPRLCVDLVIQHQGKFILILRQDHGWEGLWHMPGGTVHYQETLNNAAMRIAKEETNFDIKVTNFLGYIEFPEESIIRGFGSTVSLVFICKFKPEQKFQENEIIKCFSSVPKNTIKEQYDFLRLHLKNLV